MLLTRAVSESDGTEAELRALGADVEILPLVRIAPPRDTTPLEAAAARADSYAWIAFSSVNGVEAFARARAAGTPLRARIAAIGDATARAISRRFRRKPDLIPKTFTGAALGAELAARVRVGDEVMIVQPEGARPDLARALSHLQPRPQTVVAYQTIEEAPKRTAAAVAAADIVVLASGSAARSLAAALRPSTADALREKIIACIGPVTAEEARLAGIPVTIIARESTMRGIVAALVGHASAS